MCGGPGSHAELVAEPTALPFSTMGPGTLGGRQWRGVRQDVGVLLLTHPLAPQYLKE